MSILNDFGAVHRWISRGGQTNDHFVLKPCVYASHCMWYAIFIQIVFICGKKRAKSKQIEYNSIPTSVATVVTHKRDVRPCTIDIEKWSVVHSPSTLCVYVSTFLLMSFSAFLLCYDHRLTLITSSNLIIICPYTHSGTAPHSTHNISWTFFCPIDNLISGKFFKACDANVHLLKPQNLHRNTKFGIR